MKEKDLKEKEISLSYDPVRDIRPVDQVGFLDLRDAYVNNSIPSGLVAGSLEYNGVEDPASLLPRASDRFDAIRKAQHVSEGISKSRAVKSDGVTEGSPASSAASE